MLDLLKLLGILALIIGLLRLGWNLGLVLLLASILSNGLSSFQQTFVTLEVTLAEDKLDKSGTRDLEVMRKVSTFGYAPLIADAMESAMAEAGIEIPYPKHDVYLYPQAGPTAGSTS